MLDKNLWICSVLFMELAKKASQSLFVCFSNRPFEIGLSKTFSNQMDSEFQPPLYFVDNTKLMPKSFFYFCFSWDSTRQIVLDTTQGQSKKKFRFNWEKNLAEFTRIRHFNSKPLNFPIQIKIQLALVSLDLPPPDH